MIIKVKRPVDRSKGVPSAVGLSLMNMIIFP